MDDINKENLDFRSPTTKGDLGKGDLGFQNSSLKNPSNDDLFKSRDIESITPVADSISLKAKKLKDLSSYNPQFDYDSNNSTYRKIERRFKGEAPRGGVVFKTTFKLVNHHSSCQQCLYAFEVDTYGRGCVHDCIYCYAKEQLELHGYWNRPYPFPVDLTEIWKVFYTVFETDKKSKWRDVMESRIPIRIPSTISNPRHLTPCTQPKGWGCGVRCNIGTILGGWGDGVYG